jgi:hypothetical protein
VQLNTLSRLVHLDAHGLPMHGVPWSRLVWEPTRRAPAARAPARARCDKGSQLPQSRVTRRALVATDDRDADDRRHSLSKASSSVRPIPDVANLDATLARADVRPTYILRECLPIH